MASSDYCIEVKGELPRHLSRFGSGAVKEIPHEILALPNESEVVWKFSRDLPAGASIFVDDKATLMTLFHPKAPVVREANGSFKLSGLIFSRRFPYTQPTDGQDPTCQVETSDAITSKTRFENLKGQVTLKTTRAVQKGETVTVHLNEKSRISILCDKSGTDRLESLCKLRSDLQFPICFLPFPFFDNINLHYRLVFEKN